MAALLDGSGEPEGSGRTDGRPDAGSALGTFALCLGLSLVAAVASGASVVGDRRPAAQPTSTTEACPPATHLASERSRNVRNRPAAVAPATDCDPAGVRPLHVVISDIERTEGVGSRWVPYTVRLDRPADRTVVVRFATHAGSAAAGSDFRPRSGRLVWQPGEQSRTVLINVIDDEVREGTESFLVRLRDPSPGLTISTGVGVAMITDDDAVRLTNPVASGPRRR